MLKQIKFKKKQARKTEEIKQLELKNNNQSKNSTNGLNNRPEGTEKSNQWAGRQNSKNDQSWTERTQIKQNISRTSFPVGLHDKRCDAVSCESHKKEEDGAAKALEEIMSENSLKFGRGMTYLQIKETEGP